jgi:hypothetical protein
MTIGESKALDFATCFSESILGDFGFGFRFRTTKVVEVYAYCYY